MDAGTDTEVDAGLAVTEADGAALAEVVEAAEVAAEEGVAEVVEEVVVEVAVETVVETVVEAEVEGVAEAVEAEVEVVVGGEAEMVIWVVSEVGVAVGVGSGLVSLASESGESVGVGTTWGIWELGVGGAAQVGERSDDFGVGWEGV